MSQPRVAIRLDGHGGAQQPGSTLSGEYRLVSIARQEVQAIELSVLWHTEGKGDEDLAVHHFERLSANDGDWFDPREPSRFQTPLPLSPLSYHGLIVKILWCVRVRVYLTQGREIVAERRFQLGDVPPARESSAQDRSTNEAAEPTLEAESL